MRWPAPTRPGRSEAAPRALVLEPSGNLWGSERVLLDFLAAAKGTPWRIHVCCPPATQIEPILRDMGIPACATFGRDLHRRTPLHRVAAVLGLLWAVLRSRPNLIYVNQAGATRLALFAARLTRTPVVSHVRLFEDAEYLARIAPGASQLKRIICISPSVYDALAKLHAELPPRGRQLIDLYRPRCDWSDVPQPSQTLTLVCTGRFAAIKGQDLLLRAFALVRKSRQDLRLQFVGAAAEDDAYSTDLRQLCAALSLDDCVDWAGFQPDVMPFVIPAVAQVCPSRSEPLGRVIFEAWDAGVVPIAWAGSGGPAQVIRESGGGLLYDHQEPESLAEVIHAVLTLPHDRRQALIAAGRSWVREHCAPERYVDEMLTIWQEAVEA